MGIRTGAFLSAVVFIFSIALAGFSLQREPSPGEVFQALPKILPESPFYSLKISAEHFSLAFSFPSQAKSKKTLSLADGRLSEIATLFSLNRTDGLDFVIEEYKFLMEEYEKLPVSPKEFSRHARNIKILEDRIENDSPSENFRLAFSIVAISIRKMASSRGFVEPRESFSSSARLDAEIALASARELSDRLGEKAPESLSSSLHSAQILFREGEYFSSSSISRQVSREALGLLGLSSPSSETDNAP